MKQISNKLRLAFVAGTLLLGSALVGSAAQAGVVGPEPIGPAAGVGALVEPVQFRYGGYDYCWYPDGWRGAGWYWCGYAYRVGLGWGGPVGWNGWRFDRDDFRVRGHEHDDFRFRDHDHRDHDHDHDHDRGHDRY